MKKNKFLCIAIFLVFLSCLPIPMLAQQDSIKVISYNIRRSGDDGEHHWKKRRQATINMIEQHKPAIIGLQEVNRDQLKFLRRKLSKYGHVGVGRDNGKKKGEHLSIFYLKENFELLESGTFWLSSSPERPSKGWDAACKRTCTWVKLRTRDSQREFTILNTHLDHVGEKARNESIMLILKKMKDFGNDTPIFLTGDFNTYTTDSIFIPFMNEMQDARATAIDTDQRGTCNGWGKTDKQIDHIFIRNAKAISFSVLRDNDYGVQFISDHYPVELQATF